MSTHVRDASPEEGAAAWASGLTAAAGMMMIVLGGWQGFVGLAALLHDEVFVTLRGYTYSLDLTWWGWIHLLVAVLVASAGFAVLRGRTWGRVVGIVVTSLSLVDNFLFVPFYSFWSMTIIALDIAIIWALATGPRRTT